MRYVNTGKGVKTTNIEEIYDNIEKLIQLKGTVNFTTEVYNQLFNYIDYLRKNNEIT